MKTILLKIAAILIIGIAVYLIASFISWSFNPGEWGGFLKFIITIVYGPYVYNLIMD